MADPNPPKYLAAVSIVAGANQIRADDSGAPFDITINPGLYFVSGDGESNDLLFVIEDELNGNGADTWALSVSSAGIVSISCDADYEVNWSDGTNTTFDGSLLGFDTSADTTGSAGVATLSDYQHPYGFYPIHPIRSDTERSYESPVTQVEGLGYDYNTFTKGAHRYLRELEHYAEPSYKTYVDSSHLNQSFYAFWQLIRDGRELRYYPDTAVTDTYDSAYPDLSTIESFNPARFAQGLALYSWIVRLREKK